MTPDTTNPFDVEAARVRELVATYNEKYPHGGWTGPQMDMNIYFRNNATVIAEAFELLAEVEGAMGNVLDTYVNLANSGDAGFWDPEEEQIVIDTRALLSTLSTPAEKAVTGPGTSPASGPVIGGAE